CLAAFSWNDYW
nr:immunoglobulin heavy chain junction region [Macaca mulatta]MOW23387.1 immunoglobulin heavy chain junction region [Macaca mulatta]MOW23770.1 immunoglobulin heavy chain junction region [Macaca mulatta]MOW23908.1 immunoglobulin heavy chain junction region [Macaca mulatta]MOW24200.1 immunoglobulin heavy chain junction region [Macaca mulatta]